MRTWIRTKIFEERSKWQWMNFFHSIQRQTQFKQRTFHWSLQLHSRTTRMIRFFKLSFFCFVLFFIDKKRFSFIGKNEKNARQRTGQVRPVQINQVLKERENCIYSRSLSRSSLNVDSYESIRWLCCQQIHWYPQRYHLLELYSMDVDWIWTDY